MTIKDWPVCERPREKLIALGPQALSEAELLAIFLRTGIKNKTAVDLARDLLKKFGGLRQLLEASMEEFCQILGLGKAKYIQLQATLEMGKRYLKENLQFGDIIANSDTTKQFLTARLRHYKHEVFACLFLDIRLRVISFDELFHGTIHCANIHPREIIRRALQHNAAAIIFAHNHPSGTTLPSKEDQAITRQLIKTLSLLDIRVLDHMIVGENKVTSFAEDGLL